MLEVRVLGPVSASRDRLDVDLGGPTAATVLALLATNAPATLPAARLVEALWDEDPPASARKTLQAHVSKLRRALGPEGSDAVVSDGGGYRLDTQLATTDLRRFRELADGASAADAWRSALDLWRGEPLAGCVDSRLVEAERTRLREERLAVVEAWTVAATAEGRTGQAVAELEHLVGSEPLREHLWALLVEALAASGRRREALATYQRARRALVEETGLEPGPRLRAAEAAALAGSAERPGGHSTGARTQPLPAPRTDIVGRSEDLSGLGAMLAGSRLVTVTGPGGTGKTTVAVAAARQWCDELDGSAVFVDLVPATEADGVARALAAACGIRYLTERTDLPAAIAGRLGDGRSLLVVDNCEHVIDAASELVGALLDRAASLTVLATSRQPLDITGERMWPLAPLAPDDAVELFRRRADARRPGAGTTLDRGAVADLCEQLDHLPLAIELAAARADHLGIAETRDGLASDPELLRRHRRSGGRHGSLADAIRWSYDLLEPDEQACLRRLAVFRGRFDVDQAAAVVADVADRARAVTIVADLAGKSLVAADPDGGRSTFRLLETIRAFAWEQARQHGEAGGAAVRHRDWYLEWAEDVAPGASCLRLAAAYELEPHHADLLAALETSWRRGEHDAVAALAILGGGLLFCPGGQPDAEHWLARALEQSDALAEDRRADLLGVGALSAMMMGRGGAVTERIVSGSQLALRQRAGAAPLVLALALADVRVPESVIEVVEALLAEPDGVQDDIYVAIVGMRPFRTAWTRSLEEALDESDAVWSVRRWSDDRTMATWSVHAALLHVAGLHDELLRRLDDMETTPTDGPPTPFLTIFRALGLAGTGRPDAALDTLRSMRRHHWVHMPAVENDFLVALAAVAELCGDADRTRRLLDRPNLWSRHPSTGLVQAEMRQRLGLPMQPIYGSTDHEAVSALLDDELGR